MCVPVFVFVCLQEIDKPWVSFVLCLVCLMCFLIVSDDYNIQTHPHTVPAPRSSLQLWQFLLELLLISANTHLIQWTDSEFEFQINKPSEVAQLWGQVTNNPTMNYEKLARGLRYYYSRGIMNKVPGKKLTFKYAGNVRNYVQMRKSQMLSTHEEVLVVE